MALWYACWEGGAAGSKSRMYGGGCPRPPARTDELAAAVSAIPDATTRASVIDGGPRVCEPAANSVQGPPPRARARAISACRPRARSRRASLMLYAPASRLICRWRRPSIARRRGVLARGGGVASRAQLA